MNITAAEVRTENVSYTKSVSSRSCETGWNTRALRRIPNRQAVSSELANTRPAGEREASAFRTRTRTRARGSGVCCHAQTLTFTQPWLKSNKQAPKCKYTTWLNRDDFTSFERVLERPCDPLHGFSWNLGAKVSVKRRRSSSLWKQEENEAQVKINQNCNIATLQRGFCIFYMRLSKLYLMHLWAVHLIFLVCFIHYSGK